MMIILMLTLTHCPGSDDAVPTAAFMNLSVSAVVMTFISVAPVTLATFNG